MLKNCSWKNKSIHDIKNYNCPCSRNSCKLKCSLREKQYTIMFMIKLLSVKKKQHSCFKAQPKEKNWCHTNRWFPCTKALISTCLFSILFSIHFLRCWQGEFLKQSRATLVSMWSFLSFLWVFNVWFKFGIVRRN